MRRERAGWALPEEAQPSEGLPQMAAPIIPGWLLDMKPTVPESLSRNVAHMGALHICRFNPLPNRRLV